MTMNYDWLKIKSYYISREDISYADLTTKFGVSETAIKEHQKTLSENWPEIRKIVAAKVSQRLPEKLGENIADVTARHAKIGRAMQQKGLEALQSVSIEPKETFMVKEYLKDGVKIEREALNIEKQSPIIGIKIEFANEEIEEWAR